MKLAFVVGLYPYQIGGAEMQAKEIAIALKQYNHEIVYVCYSGIHFQSSEFYSKIILSRSREDVFFIKIRKKIYEVLNEIKPDIVYHRAFVPYSCYIANWCRKNKIPFYFHCADIYTLIRMNNNLKNIVHNIMLSYTLKNATGVICQNKEQYEALKRFNLPNVEIIYNIQSKNFQSLNCNKKKKIVWIAKFELAKQPEVFVGFAERFEDKDTTFAMFSSKCPQTAINTNLLERIKNNPRIELFEGKDNMYINDFLCKSASILVNTSVSEGISNTFIQAWMRGIPVVSLNSNPDGWFDYNDIGGCCKGNQMMIDCLVENILHKDNYERISKNSILFAENMFSPEIIAPQLIEFIGIK